MLRSNELVRLLSSAFRNVGRPLMTRVSGAATNVPVAEESSRRVAHARLDEGIVLPSDRRTTKSERPAGLVALPAAFLVGGSSQIP